MASDANGRLTVPVWSDDGVVKPIVADDGTIPIKEQSPITTIQAQNYGWDMANWHKLPMIWGFSKIVYQKAAALAVGAGSLVATCPAVLAGYVYVFTGYGIAHDIGVTRDMFIRIAYGADNYIAEVQQSVASGRWVGRMINIIVPAGDSLNLITDATAAGQHIWIQAVGYGMKIDE